jgi:hypothetical protein
MTSNNPSIEELVAESVPTNIAVLIKPYLNIWAGEVGNLARGIRDALTQASGGAMSDIIEWAEEGIARGRFAVSPTRELIAALKAARAENERLHSWDGLLSILDQIYPESIFPTLADDPYRDTGPRIVSLLRQIERVRTGVGK